MKTLQEQITYEKAFGTTNAIIQFNYNYSNSKEIIFRPTNLTSEEVKECELSNSTVALFTIKRKSI